MWPNSTNRPKSCQVSPQLPDILQLFFTQFLWFSLGIHSHLLQLIKCWWDEEVLETYGNLKFQVHVTITVTKNFTSSCCYQVMKKKKDKYQILNTWGIEWHWQLLLTLLLSSSALSPSSSLSSSSAPVSCEPLPLAVIEVGRIMGNLAQWYSMCSASCNATGAQRVSQSDALIRMKCTSIFLSPYYLHLVNLCLWRTCLIWSMTSTIAGSTSMVLMSNLNGARCRGRQDISTSRTGAWTIQQNTFQWQNNQDKRF